MLKDRTSSHTPEAFETVVIRHSAAISRAARYLTRAPCAAHDLVPDTYLRASHFWHRFTSGTQARAWVFTHWRHIHISDYHTRARPPVLVEGRRWSRCIQGALCNACSSSRFQCSMMSIPDALKSWFR
jgi:DNA-directed RNA polymerase specialized sigma24 family protein